MSPKTETIHHPESTPEWPFEKRNGIAIEQDIQTLLGPVEIELTPKEQQELVTFGHELFEGKFGVHEVGTDKDLETIYQSSATVDQQTFYLDYFFQDHRQELFPGQQAMSRAELTDFLLDTEAVKVAVDTKTRKQIAADSLKWYKEWLRGQMETANDASFQDAGKLTVHYEPQKLLQKIEDIKKYKNFYKQVMRQEALEDVSDELHEARKVVLSIHVARINGFLADLYPDALNLREQIEKSTKTAGVNEWQAQLQESLPLLDRMYQSDSDRRDELKTSLARRLDYIRNGAAVSSRDEISPISPELEIFAASLADREVSHYEAKFDAETLEKLDNARWDAEQLKGFAEDVLKEWRLLSTTESTWDEVEKRDGFADDGGYQVVITPKKDSLSIAGNKRVVWVAESFDRSLTQETPAGALPLLAHELTHVLQGIIDYKVGEKIPLAKTRGRRFLTGREAGGTFQETRVQRECFGRDRSINQHYLRALDAKIQGASKLGVINEFCTSLTTGKELNPDARKGVQAQAVDRTLRLYRNADHNSQPLDYIEQGLIMNELGQLNEREITAFLMATGSFNLHDAAELHRIGLLDVPSDFDIDPVADVMRVFTEKYLPTILNAKQE